MKRRLKQWPEIVVRTLLDNPEIVKIYIIPAVLFFLDFILRVVLDVELIDAGADMALLAVATFVSLLVENSGEKQDYTPVIVVFVSPHLSTPLTKSGVFEATVVSRSRVNFKLPGPMITVP